GRSRGVPSPLRCGARKWIRLDRRAGSRHGGSMSARESSAGGGRARPSPEAVAAACPQGTARLAAWVAGLRWAELPPPVRDAAPGFLLDYLGNAIGGSRAESSAAMGRFLRGLRLTGPATAIASALRLPPHYAPLWNGHAA